MRALMFTGSCNGFLPYVRNPTGAGIAAFRVDLETGAAEALGSVSNVQNPTFIALTPDGTSLLANSELAGDAEGAISAYAIEETSGGLTLLGSQPAGGATPAHVGISPDGRYVALANYADVPAGGGGGASLAIFAREANGRLGPMTASATDEGDSGSDAIRQDRPHAHSAQWTADGRFVVVADLGIDRLVAYRFENGKLARHGEAVLPPGSGPRHFVFSPNGRFAYVVNELSSTVTSFSFDAIDARFRMLADKPTVPDGAPRAACSAIKMAPDGRHLLAGNRGHDSIASFGIGKDGIARLLRTTPSGGQTPRDLAFAPGGQIVAVANQDSDVVRLFRYDLSDGGLTPFGAPIPMGSPTSVAFHPELA